MKRYRTLIVIVLILVVAIGVALPNNPGIHLGEYNRNIDTRLGLDLVGGVQALLEADLPEGEQPTPENMGTAKTIVENRVNGLSGVTEALVQLAGNNRIVVEVPGAQDPEQAIANIKQTVLLEFVPMGRNHLPEGTVVQTEFGQTGEALRH